MGQSTDKTLTRRDTTHSWRWLEKTWYAAKSKRSTALHYLHVKSHSTSTSSELTLWQWSGTKQTKSCPMSTVPWILGGNMIMEPINQSVSKDQLFQVGLKTKLKRDRMKWSQMLQVHKVSMKMRWKRKLRKSLKVSGVGTVVMKVKQIRFCHCCKSTCENCLVSVHYITAQISAEGEKPVFYDGRVK